VLFVQSLLLIAYRSCIGTKCGHVHTHNSDWECSLLLTFIFWLSSSLSTSTKILFWNVVKYFLKDTEWQVYKSQCSLNLF